MKKKDLFVGLVLGLIIGLLGTLVVILIMTKGNQSLSNGFQYMRNIGSIGKVITLGAIPNLLLFFYLLKKNKEMMARGIILALFILTIVTLVL
ncbi:hypothetical protein [Flavobacterium okayamense]|uniref:DUF1634 domain-containing protein n=1 Tax=Flavobacterium okayamense TaxID=2830782 RepID=A0ABN6HSH1_9FLAO|nr:hypothetical protein [Flavobacterium okayamense]BCY27528.1 hypothetical protein KK2020170_03960 [Flavobacterium okayamense]